MKLLTQDIIFIWPVELIGVAVTFGAYIWEMQMCSSSVGGRHL
jgi:hypothetical protein